MKMKKSLAKITVPALALGLAVTVHGGDAEAANPNASINGKINSNANAQAAQQNGAGLDRRLSPVIDRIQSVELEASFLTSGLAESTVLTPDEYLVYQEELESLLNRLNASTNQLAAITRQFDSNAPQILAVETDINETAALVVDTEELLDTIEIVPETDEPEVDEPEVDEPEADAPEEDAPEEDAPEEDALEEDAPVEEVPEEEDAPEEDAPVEEVSEEDVPEEEVPAEESPDANVL